MNVFTTDNDGQGRGKRHQIHNPVGVKKYKIQSHNGYCNQLNDRHFSDYRITIGQHKRHRDQKSDNLPLSDLTRLLLYLFY